LIVVESGDDDGDGDERLCGGVDVVSRDCHRCSTTTSSRHRPVITVIQPEHQRTPYINTPKTAAHRLSTNLFPSILERQLAPNEESQQAGVCKTAEKCLHIFYAVKS